VTPLLAAPIAIPLAAGTLLLLLRLPRRAEAVVSVLASLGLVGAALALLDAVLARGVLALAVGDWPAPFGISLVADRLAAAMVLVAAVIGAAVSVYALAELDERRRRFGFAFPERS
jgi:formate hydrogenlyase subunit 3/multisubunit Na+/H+ antiporter MnhD subunit